MRSPLSCDNPIDFIKHLSIMASLDLVRKPRPASGCGLVSSTVRLHSSSSCHTRRTGGALFIMILNTYMYNIIAIFIIINSLKKSWKITNPRLGPARLICIFLHYAPVLTRPKRSGVFFFFHKASVK